MENENIVDVKSEGEDSTFDIKNVQKRVVELNPSYDFSSESSDDENEESEKMKDDDSDNDPTISTNNSDVEMTDTSEELIKTQKPIPVIPLKELPSSKICVPKLPQTKPCRVNLLRINICGKKFSSQSEHDDQFKNEHNQDENEFSEKPALKELPVPSNSFDKPDLSNAALIGKYCIKIILLKNELSFL